MYTETVQQLNKMRFIILIFIVEVSLCAEYVPVSPCPEYFTYEKSPVNDYYGRIVIKNDLIGDYILQVNMTIPTKTERVCIFFKYEQVLF